MPDDTFSDATEGEGWSLRLLDNFSLRNARGDAGLTARKAIALIIYLGLQRDRMARRDTLANLLWSGVDTAQGRVNLRQAIASIRRVEAGNPILSAEPDTLALHPTVRTDVEAFARLSEGGTAERATAASLYTTDLVAGFALRDEPGFNEWLTIAQAHWRQRAVDVLLSLAEAALVPGGDIGIGTTAALKLLSIDPFNEAAHRVLMRLYVRQGRAALALAQYRGLADLLRRELQVAPEAETQALHERIRADRRVSSVPEKTAARLTSSPPEATAHPSRAPFEEIGNDSDGAPPDAVAAAPPGPSPVATVRRAGPHRWRMTAMFVAVLVAAAGSIVLWHVLGQEPVPTLARVLPVASSEDDERKPALSPDGTLVVYRATGAGGADLYMTMLGSGSAPIRLTSDPAIDTNPVWRPDGREIAFVRQTPGGDTPCVIFVRPMPVGAERAVGRCFHSSVTSLSWSADGATLYFDDDASANVARQIFALRVADGAVTPVTARAADAHGDYAPVVSHDGTHLAFLRRRVSSSDLMVKNLVDAKVTTVRRDIVSLVGFAWSHHDAGLFFTIFDGPDGGLWWTRATADTAPVRLSSGLMNYSTLSASGTGKRLVVQSSQERSALLRLGAGDAAAVPLSGFPGVASDGFERALAQSPTGRIALVSNRTGTAQLWTVEPGQGPRVLLSSSAIAFDWLSWSPTGRMIAAAATIDGRSTILLIDPVNGHIDRLVDNGAVNEFPTWSPDGRLLYWSMQRNNSSALMRIAPGHRGSAVPVVRGAFGLSRVSPDGRFLYQTLSGRPGLYRRELGTDGRPVGAATAILPNLAAGASRDWALAGDAIVYPRPRPEGGYELRRLDLVTGRATVVHVAADRQMTLSALPGANGAVLIVQRRFQNDISALDFD